MLLTEEEAKEKWCPQVRLGNDIGCNKNPNHKSGCSCVASECMMWREETEVRVKGGVGRIYGWCGLGGTPLKALDGDS